MTELTQAQGQSERFNIFQGLSQQEIEAITKTCPTRHFQTGDYIIHTGESGSHLYVILSGRVKVMIPTRDGRAHKLLTFLEYGDYFGEIALVLNVKRSADVVAVDPTQVLLLSEKKALELMGKHQHMMFNMLKYSLNRIYQLSLDSEISTLKSSDKVFYFLKWRIAQEHPQGTFYIDKQHMPSVQEIADYIGLHRSTVNDNLKQLASKGKLILDQNTYYLLEK